MSKLTDKLDQIGDKYGHNLIQEVDDAICDASSCIKVLEAKLERVENYMSDAWHHDDCPRYGGNTYLACNCGYTDLVEAMEVESVSDKLVICPNCVHQFRAISVSDQERITKLERYEQALETIANTEGKDWTIDAHTAKQALEDKS